MRKTIHVSLFAVLGVLVLFSGCASKKSTKKKFNALQSQVGTLSDEVTRLDQALQETRVAIQDEQNRIAMLERQLGTSRSRLGALRQEQAIIEGIYRTPSGFQLPSIQIQKALHGAGYYSGTLDGKIGPQSRQAVQSFQRDNGLVVDGVVGRRTWSKLKVYLLSVK